MHTTRRIATRRTVPLLLSLGVLVGAAALPSGAGAGPRSTPEGGHFDESNPGQVDGTYTPVVGNFSNVEDYDDILWYAPGSGGEQLWTNVGNRAFTKKSLGNTVTGTYKPIVGDFSGDDLDEILWYAPGPAADTLWVASGNAVFTSVPVNIGGTYDPIVLDDDDSKDDILWAKAGGGPSSVWSFTGVGTTTNSQHSTHAVTTPTAAKPLPGDFDGHGTGDVFWYGPGAVADSLWLADGHGKFETKARSVGGNYVPLVMQLTVPQPKDPDPGQFTDDIFWYNPNGFSSVWYANSFGTFSSQMVGSVGIPATPLPGRDEGDVFLWSTTKPDKSWFSLENGLFPTRNTEVGAGYTPILGAFYGNTNILFYKPGPSPEILFS